MSSETKQAEDNLVMACPECGLPVLHSCYHEGESVRSVEMPITKAIVLADAYIEYLLSKVEEAKEQRQQLIASMMDFDV